MTDKEIKEGNLLIADFMRYPSVLTTMHTDIIFEYHTSWDWLMPVVIKISEWSAIPENTPKYNKYFYGGTRQIEDFLLFRARSIDDLWRSVVSFLKWHKENSIANIPMPLSVKLANLIVKNGYSQHVAHTADKYVDFSKASTRYTFIIKVWTDSGTVEITCYDKSLNETVCLLKTTVLKVTEDELQTIINILEFNYKAQ